MAFQRIKNFFNRHKNKFIVTGVVIGGSILLAKYGQKKLREWQERETREFLEKAKKSQHFESTEKTCNLTIQNLSTTLLESIQRALNTEECVIELQNSSNDRIKVWEKFKIMIFSKLSTLVYASAILTVTLRIQLNLIGGYLYKDAQSIDGAVQQKYLTLCQVFLQDGIEKLATLIHSKVIKNIILFQFLNFILTALF